MKTFYYHLNKTYTDCNSNVWFHIEVRDMSLAHKLLLLFVHIFLLTYLINFNLKQYKQFAYSAGFILFSQKPCFI